MKKIDLSIEEIVSKYGYASEILECIDLSVVPEDQENFVVSKITEYRNFYNELYVATEYENRIEITRKIIEVLKEIEQYINRRKYMYLSYRNFTTKKELAES
jgi:hypothetical protein